MACMYPRQLPTYIRQDPLRSAECRIFDQLREQLPDAYTVFYSRPWLGLTPDGREIDGESDFVIAHEEAGLLTLEVKGGRVSRDAETETWTSRDRFGAVHIIKDPVRQARDSKYEILRKLKGHDAWKPRFIRARYGVILPDVSNPGRDLGADMPLRIFAFVEDVPHLGGWVERRMHGEEAGEVVQSLGRDGLAALELLLARSFQLRVPLSSSLAVEDRSILLLTEQQFHLLEYLQRMRCCAIEGGAGSGKTLLAAELAGRLAAGGCRTLLTCYNRPLAEGLRARLPSTSGLIVQGFHQLCFRMGRLAGLELPDLDVAGGAFDDESVDLLLRALDRLPDERFDAIVVDEGQDFHPGWLSALELCLRDEESGKLYVFFDNNQNVYAAPSALARLQTPPFPLTRNLRNTTQIFDLARSYYAGQSYVGAGPEGHEIDWIAVDGGGLTDELMRTLGRLTRTEGIAAENIAILAGDRSTLDVLRGRLGARYRLTDAEQPREGVVTLDTVRRFKGLESQVVILIATERLLDDLELMYVALTRARLYLVVLAPETVLRILKSKHQRM